MSTRRRVGVGPLAFLRGRGCALVLAAAALCPAGARAETAEGALSGVVRDPAGAVVPGATVRVLSEAGAPVTEVATDGAGAYRVPALVSGTYRVEAALSGFEPARRRVAVDAGQAASADLSLGNAGYSETTVVTARRVEETLQEVPIAVSAVSGDTLTSAGAYNVERLKELVPTVQFYSSNPRNSSISIRGLGAPFGLTNDGIEPGVGLYVDGVFFARPAAATLDFLDVERVEVLRGPQGTLFGKNTTAGGVSIVSRRPSFVPEGDLELSYGSSDFVQAKGAFSSAFSRTVAGRLSFSRTGRDGNILNTSDERAHERARQHRRARAAAVRTLADARDRRVRRPLAPAAGRVRAGGGGRHAHAAPGQPAVGRHRGRPALRAAERRRVRPPGRHRHRMALHPGPGRRLPDRGLDGRRRPGDVGERVALLELGPLERPRLHGPARHHHLGGDLEAAAVDAGVPLGRRPRAEPAARGRGVRVPPVDRLGSELQAGAGSGRRARAAGADRGRGDTRPAGRLRVRPVPEVPQPQHGRVRAGQVVRDRPAERPAGSAGQLRREGRRLRADRLRRPADDEPGAHRAAAVDPGAAGVHGGRRRHQHVGSADGLRTRYRRTSTPTRRARPASSPSGST